MPTQPDTRSELRYRCATDIRFEKFGDDYAVFHRASGRTHFINAPSYHLLSEIRGQVRDFDAILEDFDLGSGDGEREAAVRYLRQLMDRLESLGLVRRD